MNLFALVSRSAPSVAERACVRHTSQNSHCLACISACPTGAISLNTDKISINDDECIDCGHCLFACPVGEVDNLQPPLRHYRDDRLIAPLSLIPASINELLIWHAEYQIRAVELDMELHSSWMMAVAGLNIQLKQLNEPLWYIFPIKNKSVDIMRRQWLQIKDQASHKGSVSPGGRGRREYFQAVSEYQIALDPAFCLLCGACERVCSEKAIKLDNQSMRLEHALCIGCHSCDDVCPVKAIKVQQYKPYKQTQPTILAVKESLCRSCQRPFINWSNQFDTQCPICRKQVFRMREA